MKTKRRKNHKARKKPKIANARKTHSRAKRPVFYVLSVLAVLSVLSAILFYIVPIVFILLRLLTLPSSFLLDDTKQTINVPPDWLFLIYFCMLFAVFEILLFSLGRFAALPDTINIGDYISDVITVGQSTIFIVFIYFLIECAFVRTPFSFGNSSKFDWSYASLPRWLLYPNTWKSRSTHTQVIETTPVSFEYKHKRWRQTITWTQITPWEKNSDPIMYKVKSEQLAPHEKYCIDVHKGLYGLDWINNLHVCSPNELGTIIDGKSKQDDWTTEKNSDDNAILGIESDQPVKKP